MPTPAPKVSYVTQIEERTIWPIHSLFRDFFGKQRVSSILWPNGCSYFNLFFCEKELGIKGHQSLAADMKYHIGISLYQFYGQLCIKNTLANTEQ